MPTLGELIVENLKETGPGIKGTSSGMGPQAIGELLLTQGSQKVVEREKPGWLPSWLAPVGAAAAQLPTAIGSIIAGKKGKRLFTKSARVRTVPYQERINKLTYDLRNRGYSNEDIQKVADILASAYGEEAVDVERIRAGGALGGPRLAE